MYRYPIWPDVLLIVNIVGFVAFFAYMVVLALVL